MANVKKRMCNIEILLHFIDEVNYIVRSKRIFSMQKMIKI